jgi:hypothetical protein
MFGRRGIIRVWDNATTNTRWKRVLSQYPTMDCHRRIPNVKRESKPQNEYHSDCSNAGEKNDVPVVGITQRTNNRPFP